MHWIEVLDFFVTSLGFGFLYLLFLLTCNLSDTEVVRVIPFCLAGAVIGTVLKVIMEVSSSDND